MIPYINISLPHIFGFRFEAFGILVFIACMIGIHFAKKRALEKNLSIEVIDDIALYCCVLSGFLGAHLFHFLAYEQDAFFNDPLIYFKHFRSGLSSYGGFISAAVATGIYLYRKKLPYILYAETIVFGLLPGWIFGRLGCTTAHDHPGAFTNFFLGVKYPEGVRHDLGFYEFLLTIAMTIFIYTLDKMNKHRFDGFYLALCFMIYGVARFFLEFLQVLDPEYSGLTVTQYISAGLTIYGLFLYFSLKRKHAQKNS